MKRWTRTGLLLGLLLLAGAVVAWVSWLDRPLPVPEVDLAGVDPAVAAAIDSARQTVLRKPGSGEAWGRLGMVLGAHGFTEEASRCLDQAGQFQPAEPCWPYLSGVVLAPTSPEQAVPRLRLALQRARGPAGAARLRLAGLLLSMGELEEAEKLYEEVKGGSAGEAQVRLGLARIAVARGDLEASLPHLEKARKDDQTRKAASLLLAEVSRRKGDQAAASRLAQEAAELPDDPELADPWHERMECVQVGEQAQVRRANRLLQQDQVGPAITLLEQTARDYPDSASVWQALGRALVQARQYPRAGQAFRRVLELAPERAEALFYLGVVAHEQGDPAAAAGYFEQATRKRPDHALAWYNLAQCRRKLGRPDEAIAALRESIRFKPHNGQAHIDLARLLVEAGRSDEAREHLQAARRLGLEGEAVKLLRQFGGKK